MTNYIGWTPPPGVAVVAPPVHPKSRVRIMWSDGIKDDNDGRLAGSQNWSSVGDGPSIVAYAVVEEYKPAPWDGYVFWDNGSVRFASATAPEGQWRRVIHVREVLPAAREVVAWAVVRDGTVTALDLDVGGAAFNFSCDHGGTVVKLTGVMP